MAAQYVARWYEVTGMAALDEFGMQQHAVGAALHRTQIGGGRCTEGLLYGEFVLQRRTVDAALASNAIGFSHRKIWRASHNDAIAQKV